MGFPDGFVWGAAASAYQIEGATATDGRGPCIWDAMCRRPGAIWRAQNAEIACDHYHRFAEDVSLMSEIGLMAYRFSVSWPRVFPSGTGSVNPPGLDFYDRLVDELLRVGITPYLTLFHWDLPEALYLRGGWLNRESAAWFGDYAKVLAERLGDRVTNWLTINEPQVFVAHGLHEGIHAPGDRLPLDRVLLAGHNLLRAHGAAVQAIRADCQAKCDIAFAPVGDVKIPASDRPEDVDAAYSSMFSVTGKTLFNNAWWMDPVLLGRYPDDGLEAYGTAAPEVHAGDMELIAQPIDFLGANIYVGERIEAGKDGAPAVVPPVPGDPVTAMGWPVVPEALYWGPKFYCERYRMPLMITENGVTGRDWLSLDGCVHDPHRIDFARRYLLQLGKAIDDGAEVRGYLHWSILDNFEWAEGYKERFGLIFVDYATQRRVLKDSAHWYKRVVATNGTALDDVAQGAPVSV